MIISATVYYPSGQPKFFSKEADDVSLTIDSKGSLVVTTKDRRIVYVGMPYIYSEEKI
jgi:acyl-homoserine lactone acylase PvdQ